MKSAEVKDQDDSDHPDPSGDVGMSGRNNPGNREQARDAEPELSDCPGPLARMAVHTLRDRSVAEKTARVHSWPPEQVRGMFPGGAVTSGRLLPCEPFARRVDGGGHRPHQRPPRKPGRRELSHVAAPGSSDTSLNNASRSNSSAEMTNRRTGGSRRVMPADGRTC